MVVMLPDNLIWIMEKIGLEWPDINEDEVHKGADLTRQFRDDLEALIQKADSRIVTDVSAGIRSKSGEAYVTAWNTTRTQNLQPLLDSLDPIAFGMDAAGHVVVGLKWKVVGEIAFTMVTLVPLLALGPLGAVAAAAKMVATKVATGIAVDLAVSALIEAVDEPIIQMLQDVIPGIVQAVLDAPLVEDLGNEVEQIAFDLAVLEQAESDMQQQAGDMESIITTYMGDIAALELTS